MSRDTLPSPDVPAVLRDGRDPEARGNFLPYPASTLGPAIIPNDLTSFRSRGVSEVSKRLQQELVELRDAYSRAVDQFNWNKLVYESSFAFEPVVGEIYHLYRQNDGYLLSMVGPGEWARPHVGTFRLNIDRCWEVVALAEGVRGEEFFGSQVS